MSDDPKPTRSEAMSNFEEYFGSDAADLLKDVMDADPDPPPDPPAQPSVPEAEQVVGGSVGEYPLDRGGVVGDPIKVDAKAVAEREEALLNAIVDGRRADVDRLATRSSHGRKR